MKLVNVIASALAVLFLVTGVVHGATPVTPSPEVSVYLNPD